MRLAEIAEDVPVIYDIIRAKLEAGQTIFFYEIDKRGVRHFGGCVDSLTTENGIEIDLTYTDFDDDKKQLYNALYEVTGLKQWKLQKTEDGWDLLVRGYD
jgi:hypothetical protein